MEVEEKQQKLSISNLFQKSHEYYQNSKDTGFYVSRKSINGFHLAVYKPYEFYIWKDYVPESVEDLETVSRSWFESKIFKSFYCNACAISEPDGVIVKKPCKNNSNNNNGYPKTKNVANLVYHTQKFNNIPFIICASAQQYYYNHLLFQSLDHKSSYTIFEDFNLFLGMFEALKLMTHQDKDIKMVFNGNFGSNKYHFHTHITPQTINYVEKSNPISGMNDNQIFENCIKYRIIADYNIQVLFNTVQKCARYVYNPKDYTSENKYLAAVFSIRFTGNKPLCVVHITSGNKFTNLNTSNGESIRLIIPSAIINLSETSNNINIKNEMNSIMKIIKYQKIYEYIPIDNVDTPIPENSIEYLELQLLKLDKKWSNTYENNLKIIYNHIVNTCNNNSNCIESAAPIFAYLLSRYIIYFMGNDGINNSSSTNDYIDAYRSLYKDKVIRDMLIKFGFYHIHQVYGDSIKSNQNYLRGSIGVTLGNNEFHNYFMVSSENIGSYNNSDFLKLTPSISEWVSSARSVLIGDKSGCGNVMKAQLSYDTDHNFVIKTSKLNANCTPLEEEFATGFKLNNLRNIIPNILLTYGGFSCERAPGNTGLCSAIGGIKTDFLALEYVDGISLKSYIRNESNENIMNCLYQTFFALYFAQKYNKFTHYDLHDQNMMVSKLDSTVQYNYHINNNEYIFTTDINCTIIDFGWSRVDGVKYGDRDPIKTKWGPSLEFSQCKDIYSLLMCTLRSYLALKGANDILSLQTRSNTLGVVLGQLWDEYISIRIGACSFETLIGEAMKYRHANINKHEDDLLNEMTGLMDSLGKSEPGTSIRFLPRNHPEILNSVFSNPLNLIDELSPLLSVNKIPTLNIYNWGDTDYIGCDGKDIIPPKIKLIDHISTSLKLM